MTWLIRTRLGKNDEDDDASKDVTLTHLLFSVALLGILRPLYIIRVTLLVRFLRSVVPKKVNFVNFVQTSESAPP